MSHDAVNHPQHYASHPSGVECITVTRHMNFNIGNAVKYLWRAGLKGAALEDLKKAAWYINDEIARIEREEENAKQSSFDFGAPLVANAKRACESYMRPVGAGEEAQPSCFGTPEVLNAQQRAENCCDACGFVNGCYERANR